MAGFGSFAPTGAAFGTMTPQEEGELPPSILDKIVAAVGNSIGKAAMVPGQVLNSPTPLTSGDMIAPATDMAMTLMGGSSVVPAEANALNMGAAFLRPAIRHEGKLYKGDTHLDALAIMPNDMKRVAALDGNNRGFVNDKGRFMDRYKAQKYAVSNDLIDPSLPSWTRTAPELIAEWLKK